METGQEQRAMETCVRTSLLCNPEPNAFHTWVPQWNTEAQGALKCKIEGTEH